MTCITIARPQIMCSGLGRAERIRVPSPAASTIAETVTREPPFAEQLRGEDSNPYTRNQNPVSYH